MQIEEHNTLIELFDLYGSLLSNKQHNVMDKYLNYDIGESELGAEFGESRQAVHDAITKAKKQLFVYEEKCKFNAKLSKIRTKLQQIAENSNDNEGKLCEKVEKIIKDI